MVKVVSIWMNVSIPPFFLNINFFTDVSRFLSSVTLFGFKKDPQAPSVVIGSRATAACLLDGNVITQVSKVPLVEGIGGIYLFSITTK